MESATKRDAGDSRLGGARLAAGAAAGLAGGLAFGFLMIAPAIMGDNASFEGTGMMLLLARLLGTDAILATWGVHLLNSAIFGVVFALLVRPGGFRRDALLGAAWGFLLWLGGAFLLLRTLTGTPLVLDAQALYSLLGHLVYGAVMGFVYVAFFHEEEGLLRRARASRRATARP